MEEPTNKFTIPLAIVAAGALIAGAIYFGGGTTQPITGYQKNDNADIEVPAVSETDHYLGSRNAKMVIVEYSDTECPFCKVFHYTMKEVLNAYGNDVAWVFRHFPIPQLHAKAKKEADATECAAELGGNQIFWNYLDGIFEKTQSNDSLDPAELPRIASSLGLDVATFNACLASGKYSDKVSAQMEEAVKAGARGTPYSLILDSNGEIKGIINGAEPLASIKVKINTFLK